jgi:hypothetical protein
VEDRRAFVCKARGDFQIGPRRREAKMKIAALAAATIFAVSPAAACVFVVPGYSSPNDVLKPCSPSVLAHALKPGTFAWAKDQCTWVPPGTEMPKMWNKKLENACIKASLKTYARCLKGQEKLPLCIFDVH